ncbi:MAG: beta-ketoacyl-[acyl-carrier-protein] synthase II [Dehalococcoidia bacterium]|nr:beta-ketoacyl-[acyl-carrier-protein] synthase II [Dehalococcoidia bacterium]
MSERVVITGMGAVTPLGLDMPSTWDGLLNGRSGMDYITAFETEGFETTFAAEVKGFDPTNYLDRKEARRMDRFVHFAIAATKEAMAVARFVINDGNATDVGVIIGSGIGGIITLSEQMQVLAQKGPGRISPFLIPMMIGNMAAGQTSIVTGAKGPNFATVSACSSGADAVGQAFETIRRGDARVMLTGGAEAPICPIGVSAFNAARALSTRNSAPQGASRPFDAQRDGFVMGEGACVLVLEALDHAQARGATIIAEMASYAATADAFHITQPAENGEGGARAMTLALRRAGLQPEAVDYINAHGTSTQMNDKFETLAIKGVLGDHARRVAVSSTKSMVGHLLGAAGAFEAAVCALAIREGAIPPTINYEHPDPECDLDYVPNEARHVPVRVAMSNSFGFGGHNSCVVLKRYEA